MGKTKRRVRRSPHGIRVAFCCGLCNIRNQQHGRRADEGHWKAQNRHDHALNNTILGKGGDAVCPIFLEADGDENIFRTGKAAAQERACEHRPGNMDNLLHASAGFRKAVVLCVQQEGGDNIEHGRYFAERGTEHQAVKWRKA